MPNDASCPGCNNSWVKSNANNPLGCGRGNPNNTIAPGWCPFHFFRVSQDNGVSGQPFYLFYALFFRCVFGVDCVVACLLSFVDKESPFGCDPRPTSVP